MFECLKSYPKNIKLQSLRLLKLRRYDYLKVRATFKMNLFKNTE